MSSDPFELAQLGHRYKSRITPQQGDDVNSVLAFLRTADGRCPIRVVADCTGTEPSHRHAQSVDLELGRLSVSFVVPTSI